MYAVSDVLFHGGCNIIDSQQFGDQASGLFFLRVHFDAPEHHLAETAPTTLACSRRRPAWRGNGATLRRSLASRFASAPKRH